MISSSRFLCLLPLFRQFAYPFSETSNIWHMRTMGNSWRCSWINRNFTAGAARRCSPLQTESLRNTRLIYPPGRLPQTPVLFVRGDSSPIEVICFMLFVLRMTPEPASVYSSLAHH